MWPHLLRIRNDTIAPVMRRRGPRGIRWLRSSMLVGGTLNVAAACRTGPPAPDGAVPFEKFRLSNGLQVIVSPDHSAPLVAVEVWYDAGSKRDTPGRTGLSHLVEHLMFQGSRNVPAGRHAEFIASLGGAAYGVTIESHSRFYQVVPAHRYNLALWLEADRMHSLAVGPADLRREQAAVEAEERLTVDNQPYRRALWRSRAQPYVSATCFGQTHAPLGSMQDVRRASLEDVHAFHRTYFGPSNATLVVVGDVAPAEVRELTRRYFGSIPGQDQPPAAACSVDFAAGFRLDTVYDPGISAPAVNWSYRVPAATDARAAAVSLLSDLLTDRDGLAETLTGPGKPAEQVSGWHDRRDGPGLLWFSAIAAPGVTGDSLLRSIEAAVHATAGRVLDAEHMTRAKARFRTLQRLYRRAVQDKANLLGEAAMLGTLARVDGEITAYEAVTTEELRAVVGDFVHRENLSMLLVLKGESRVVANPGTATRAPAYDEPVDSSSSVYGTNTVPSSPPPPLRPTGIGVAPVEFVLDNGLRVVVIEDAEQPLAVIRSYTPVSGTTSLDSTWAAGVMGRLLDDGTATRTRQDVRSWAEHAGAFVSATGADGVVSARITFGTELFSEGLDLVADMLRYPAFDSSAVAQEVARARTRVGQVPDRAEDLADLIARERQPGDQRTSAAPEPDRDAIVRLHQQLIRPDRTVLLLAGGVPARRVAGLVEAAFGTWPAPRSTSPGPEPRASAADDEGPDSLILVHRPGSAESLIRIEVRLAGTSARSPALDVMQQVLGGGQTGRLFRELRERRRWVYDASTSFDRLEGRLSINIPVRTELTDSALVAALDVIASLRSGAIADAELETAKGFLVGSFGTAHELPEDRGEAFVRHLLRGTEEDFLRYVERIGEVDPRRVREVAGTVLARDRLAVIVVGDARRLYDDLGRLGPVRVVGADGTALRPDWMGRGQDSLLRFHFAKRVR